MNVEHTTAQRVFVGELTAFMAALGAIGDVGPLTPSRCRGWSSADVVVHVHLGLQELRLGVHAPSDAEPDTDAASYWKGTVPTNDTGADDLDAIRLVQRMALSYRRPTGIVSVTDRTGRTGPAGIVAATHQLSVLRQQ